MTTDGNQPQAPTSFKKGTSLLKSLVKDDEEAKKTKDFGLGSARAAPAPKQEDKARNMLANL